MNLRRISWVLIAATAALAIAAYVGRARLGERMLSTAATSRFGTDAVARLPDGLYVGLCGAGSPLPDQRRSGPCTVVIAGRRLFLVDAGSGAARSLARMGFDAGGIEALFLTHYHSDHIDGLGEVMLQRWAGGAHADPLPVHGPTGIEQVLGGFMGAYALDESYRVAHHGARVVPPSGFGGVARSFVVTEPDGRVVLVDEPDLQIVAFAVEHDPVHPAVGYRIRYKYRTAVLSGDTSKSAAVQREASGVDLLVHEGLSPRLVGILQQAAAEAGRENLARIFHDIPGYHTTPEQAAEIARDAGVGFLLINHVVPALTIPGSEEVFLGDARKTFAGTVRVGVDGDFVGLPAGSKAIVFSNLD